MNNIDTFLSFASQHPIKIGRIKADNATYRFCCGHSCDDCVNCYLRFNKRTDDTCNGYLKETELEHLKLNYPEYFI